MFRCFMRLYAKAILYLLSFGDHGRLYSVHMIFAKYQIFIPRHTIVAGYYGFMLDVRVSVRQSARPSVVRPSSVFVSGW